jgi:small subunit ribosomal protein S8
MHTDPIADYLTRIRNAMQARKRIVDIPSSKIKVGITKVLLDMGYIAAYKEVEDDKQGILKIALKYDPVTKQPAITFIQRVSTPGLRRYVKSTEIPRVLNGMGIAIMTTSKGIMTGQKAKAENVGGEVLCYVY